MRNVIKKIIYLFLFVFILLPNFSDAQSNQINTYFFYGDGCPHCAEEKELLHYWSQTEYQNLKIYEYEIYNNRENILLLQKIAKEFNVQVDGVPFLVIGDEYFIGYSDTITRNNIKKKLDKCLINKCNDLIAPIIGFNDPNDINTIKNPVEVIESEFINQENEKEKNNTEDIIVDEIQDKKIIKLSVLGEVDVVNFSLPLITIVMGVLDGFNPCAMWILLFLISLLLGMKDRKRMWILGIMFIVTSSFVYFLFMSAWLNLILFLGFVAWFRILIGLFALFGGFYSIKEFLLNKDSGCKVTGEEKRQRIFERMKSIIKQNSLFLSLIGIIALAFVVNLVELICSAGLPAIYTQVLALNSMSGFKYYLYILLYVFFFMLDDLFVFFVAMITLKMTGVTTKYTRASRLIGGIIMLLIGLMLIFKPQLLMFG
ncbi:MAG: hypothetical protein PHH83_00845 [Patescibacteria group bacterium]|nr:hypothetical protein [Patescibacteria group bacterium]